MALAPPPKVLPKKSRRRSPEICPCGNRYVEKPHQKCRQCLQSAREARWKSQNAKMRDINLHNTQHSCCNGCHFYISPNGLTIDHKIPRQRGGLRKPENQQLLCFRCNMAKGSRTMEEAEEKGAFDKYREAAIGVCCDGCRNWFPPHGLIDDKPLCFRCNSARRGRSVEAARDAGVFDKYYNPMFSSLPSQKLPLARK